MKKASLSVCAALAAATLCAARAEPTLREPNDWEGRVRLSAGGFGRFGTETKIDLIEWSDRGELWGAGLDAQFQLVSDKDLTVWLGVGTSYVPEQEIATLGLSAGGVSAAGKMELKAYDFRVMLIPEVQICEELAMGLRLGLGVSRAEGTGTLTASYAGFSAGGSQETSETLVHGIIGVQATWALTDNLGLFAYVDGRFGNDLELEVEGVEICNVKATSCEVGLGLQWTF